MSSLRRDSAVVGFFGISLRRASPASSSILSLSERVGLWAWLVLVLGVSPRVFSARQLAYSSEQEVEAILRDRLSEVWSTRPSLKTVKDERAPFFRLPYVVTVLYGLVDSEGIMSTRNGQVTGKNSDRKGRRWIQIVSQRASRELDMANKRHDWLVKKE